MSGDERLKIKIPLSVNIEPHGMACHKIFGCEDIRVCTQSCVISQMTKVEPRQFAILCLLVGKREVVLSSIPTAEKTKVCRREKKLLEHVVSLFCVHLMLECFNLYLSESFGNDHNEFSRLIKE